MKVPILRLGRILLTSVLADLVDEQAVQLQSEILALIRDDRADGVVIDISGLDVVDSYIARLLNETASMVRIIGGEAVLTGMQPLVALTLVEMGRETLDMQTALDLEAGVAVLNDLIAAKGQPPTIAAPHVDT
ncbi:RsbT antagonist protein RsbS [Rhodoplanes serenus]|jgi:rsbT antagonist protein RsbS|uniref:RsbT antagonist protein RsbS n=1 Tax=Rhodoplanes serenus TaxID=200615 RepID=A0A3S4DCL7_9BRAD|nr:STAS domain-containing protein [Rhodoplanes serenus]MBI5112212.1 STAS domain-containing protein [Rhodovulum sp.]VCU06958.1 RsbT antagonist protein RsbS [Rhodoplanes serenus]